MFLQCEGVSKDPKRTDVDTERTCKVFGGRANRSTTWLSHQVQMEAQNPRLTSILDAVNNFLEGEKQSKRLRRGKGLCAIGSAG